MRIIIILFVFLAGWPGWSVAIEGVNFPDEISLRGRILPLNGAALRVKRKFGMNFKVYAAALWVPVKSSVPEVIMEPGDKVVELVFLRSLDKDTMVEAWTKSFTDNCLRDCQDGLKQVRQFNELMVDVKRDSRLRMIFDKEGVDVEINGLSRKVGRVEGAVFTRNLMAAFVGPSPATEDLKRGLLGL